MRLDAIRLAEFSKRPQKGFTRQDRRCGNGNIGFRLVALLKLNGAPLLHQRVLDDALRAKLVGHCPWAIRNGLQDIFNAPRMSPRQQCIHVAHLRVEAIVGFRPNGDNGKFSRSKQLPRLTPDKEDRLIGELLTIFDTELLHGMGDIRINIDGARDKRTKEVALAALINAHVRGDRLWVDNFLIPQRRALQHIRLEEEEDKVCGSPALHQTLAAFVEVDVAVLRLYRHEGVRHLLALVVTHVQEDFEGLLLFLVQDKRI
jgi:hypothetical protein